VHQDYLNSISNEYPEGITLEQLGQHKWITYVDNLLFTEQLSYLKELDNYLGNELKPSFSSTSIISQYFAIKSGLGIGILPCFLADQDENLVKLHSKEICINRSFWLVTHPESKRLTHVNTVWKYLKNLVIQHDALLNPPP
jgi:DNA-binding transcriptional LysR family regulator